MADSMSGVANERKGGDIYAVVGHFTVQGGQQRPPVINGEIR